MPVASTQPVYPPPPGNPVEAVWGVAVSESVIQRFTTISDRDTKWTAPIPTGAQCVTTSPSLIEWIYDGVKWVPTGGVMIGEIKLWPITAIPTNWLVCDGRQVSRVTYAFLFAAIGNVWGSGDGTSTFNLPDLQGRAPVGAGAGTGLTARFVGAKFGAETHQLVTAELPVHTHSIDHGHVGTVAAESGHYHTGTVDANGNHDHGTDSGIPGSDHTPPPYFAGVTGGPSAGKPQLGNGGAIQLYADYFDGTSFSGTHAHTFTTSGTAAHTHGVSIVPAVGQASGSAGSNVAHNNVQPSAVVNFIIFAGTA